MKEGRRNFGPNTVSVIQTVHNTVVARVPVGVDSFPVGVAITPDGAFAYVTNNGSTTVSVIATAPEQSKRLRLRARA